VADKVVTPTTHTNTAVEWPPCNLPLAKSMLLLLMAPRTTTWRITVNTIRGKPHAQSAPHPKGLAGGRAKAVAPILIKSLAHILKQVPWHRSKSFAALQK
jgi:hypothetical protein